MEMSTISASINTNIYTYFADTRSSTLELDLRSCRPVDKITVYQRRTKNVSMQKIPCLLLITELCVCFAVLCIYTLKSGYSTLSQEKPSTQRNKMLLIIRKRNKKFVKQNTKICAMRFIWLVFLEL